jgi:hypothetical protein
MTERATGVETGRSGPDGFFFSEGTGAGFCFFISEWVILNAQSKDDYLK